MLIKASGVIKSIMNKNVKTNKQNFRTKIMNKTNFLVMQEIIIDKIEKLIKKPYFLKNGFFGVLKPCNKKFHVI